jgi:hypothetical protein
MLKFHEIEKVVIAELTDEKIVISEVQDALDMMGECGLKNCNRIIIKDKI